MTLSETRKWIKLNKSRLIYQYGLDDWIIDICVKDTSDNDYGDTLVLWNYKKADINIYAHKHNNIKDLEHTLRHELCHVLLAPYEELEDLTSKLVKLVSKEKLIKVSVGQLMVICAEHAVMALEKMSKRHRGIK